jgi:hypothetical protein
MARWDAKRDSILVTADTPIEHGASFICTAQLNSGIEHFLAPTIFAELFHNSFCFPIFGGQGLDRRSLGPQC